MIRKTAGNSLAGSNVLPILQESKISTRPPRIKLSNLPIDTYSQRDFLVEVIRHAVEGNRTRQIVTANAQFYVLAEKDHVFRRCIDAAEYICADGMALVWACRSLLHARLPRINGTNLIEDICREGAVYGLRIYLLGGKPGSASVTAQVLKTRYPGIEIAGVDCPDFGFESNPASLTEVLGKIQNAKPHVVFVSLGAPKQEFFIDQHLRPLQVPLAVGIGGSFELISGKIERAPRWFQDHGLEWAFRFAQEPRRLWKRYLIGNTEFLWGLLKWQIISLLTLRPALDFDSNEEQSSRT